MDTRIEIRVLLISILFLIPLTAGLTTYVVLQARENSGLSTDINGYTTPKWLGGLVAITEESLVTINCQEEIGSGFSYGLDNTDVANGFEFRSEDAKTAPSLVITNLHVVDACLSSLRVSVIGFDKTKSEGRILEIDELNDLAMIRIESIIPSLFGAYAKPVPGYWAMAMGSPHNFTGSVTFGNIINLDATEVFHTASLSPGNSGGPLSDNEGYLLGVNTGAKPIGQNFNISIGINAFCDRLIECTKRKYWTEK